MDYNNMNRRASRSAYNNNRPGGSKPAQGKRRPAQVKNQPQRPGSQPRPQNSQTQTRQPRPHNPQTQTRQQRPQNPQAQTRQQRPQNPQMQSRQQRPQNSQAQTRQQRPQNPQQRNNLRQGSPRPNPNASNKRPPQNTQGKRPTVKNAPVKKSPPKPQAQKRDWIYPEGYVPQRPPQNQLKSNQNPQRRPQQKRKPEPAIKIKIDWQRVGVVCTALAVRFLIALLMVVSAMGIFYRIDFYSQPAPINEEVVYNFVTVTGEGDDAVKTTNSILVEGYSAYDRSELLISFSEVSKWLGTAQVGDIYSMRFVFGDENVSQTVVFHNSSQDAFVNGTPIAMKTRAQFRHGEVWVPVSFIKDYITGITITEKNNAVNLEFNEEELSFSLSPTDPLMPVPLLEDEY